METLATNEIEMQFAHLPPEEQSALLERLAHQMRAGAEVNGHVLNGEAPMQTADPRFRREWDRVTVDFRAAESDLLGEI